MTRRYFKVIACEIAFREICHVAARSPNVVDLEFVTQGLHDFPRSGTARIQERIDAVPAGKYEAILIGYGLCGNLIARLTTAHTPLVLPRAHDCITFFLGSKERYGQLSQSHAGAYYYSSGWLECRQRRGEQATPNDAWFLPSRADLSGNTRVAYESWVRKYGEEQARHLLDVMERWTDNYTHGVLIDFDFTRPLHLRDQVHEICARRGWRYEEIDGDLSLLQRWVNGEWDADDFLVVPPRHRIMPSYDDRIVAAQPIENEISAKPGPDE